MRTPTLIVALIALLVGAHDAAAASSCPYQHPARAKSFQSSLVQAFIACAPWEYDETPNATTEAGVPSCYPASTFHEQAGSLNGGWRFGPNSRGSVALKVLGTDVSIDLSLRGIWDQSGPTTSTGTMVMVLRLTLVDPVDGAMTVVDFPFGAALPLTNGQGKIKTTLNAALHTLVPGWDLAPCNQAEILNIQVRDALAHPFAVPGLFLP